jgi:hypothetical protein
MKTSTSCLAVAFLALALTVFPSVVRADEGMWLPLLLEQLNQKDMQMKGFHLSAADVYSVNHTSMKDAVVQFDGGCTAELVSNKGLLLTNHHCGFRSIQSLSSVDHDYLANGFWAMKQTDELVNPGLVVTFIIRMEDVTERVLQHVTPQMTESARDSVIKKNFSPIGREAIKGTPYETFLRPFFSGNQYFMFITETFRDVRLVGAPPSSIGKFGSDADNWVWPRHTGDFSVFRIYANKNNQPADYSPDNIPYTPKYFFPVSLKGEQPGDFTMVYGFPGRTNEYMYSGGVNLIQNVSNPTKVGIRDVRLAIIDQDMRESEKVHIQYANKQSLVANAWKKWSGETYGLKRYNAIEKKKTYEQEFQKRVEAEPVKFKDYSHILKDLQVAYDSLIPYQLNADYFNEVTSGIEVLRYTVAFEALDKLSTKVPADTAETDKAIRALRAALPAFYKDYNVSTDKKVCAALLRMYAQHLPPERQPDILRSIASTYKGDFNRYTDELFAKSMFVSKEKTDLFLLKYKPADAKKLRKDPAYQLMLSMYKLFRESTSPGYRKWTERIALLNRVYMKGQMEVMVEKKYYPDANSTLRVAYGQVGDYSPRDGVTYNWYTTIDGLMQKEDPAVEEFHVAPKLKELWMKKEYGAYADKKGELHVAFIANNHTSGGNSGSPVLDADGNLIGTNFDRCWEGTMSDEAFDPSFCRNISVDIRYTLFVIDKFAGAGYLLDEMKVVR